jgi:hypothetical protein
MVKANVFFGTRPTTQLAALDLTEEDLRGAIQQGLDYFADCTGFDPPSGPGFMMWAKANARLRESLAARGWTPNDDYNYPTCIHPSGEWAITVVSGDANTGRPYDPASKWPKGRATRRVVRQNRDQLSLSDLDPVEFPPLPAVAIDRESMFTWMLLYYLDEDTHEVRMELSLPEGFDEARRVSQWNQRYPLTALAYQSHPEVAQATDESYEAPVERRAQL